MAKEPEELRYCEKCEYEFGTLDCCVNKQHNKYTGVTTHTLRSRMANVVGKCPDFKAKVK